MLKIITMFLLLSSGILGNNASYNQGKEFIFSFIPNYISTGADLFIYIVGQNDAQGVVEIPSIAYAKAFSIKKDEVLKIELPDYTDIFQKNHNKVVKATIFVYASADVSIYGFNRKGATTDAFLTLPKQSLGYEYIVSSYGRRLDQNYGLAMNGVALVTAAYDNTKVVIVPNETSPGEYATAIPFEIELDKGDSYALYGGDVTGTHIRSTFPVSVMGGNECTFIPLETAACDHIVENEPPLSTWGKKYITVPFKGKKSDMFRITASQNNTILYINGEQAAILNKGEHYEDITPESMYIEGTNPILVTQFMLGGLWDNTITDPMMVVIPPYEQYMDDYFFSSLSKAENAQKNHVNVTIPTSAINTVVLDGEDINSSLFTPIQMTEYSSAQLPLKSGSHHISASKPFGIVVYGTGYYESYGYTGGSAYRFINNRTDKYAPNIGLVNGVKLIHGIANDDEDINQNNVLELEEDLNKNNKIDRRTEDINGNNILDEGEDEDGDDLIDIDGGIYSITLDENATNVQLNVDEYVPGSTRVEFTISLIDQDKPGSGTVIVSDGVGNLSKEEFVIPVLYHNVEVISTLLVDELTLDVNSFSVEPKSIITDGTKTEITWKFDEFNMTQVENLDYEIELNSVFPGETKVITKKLQVNYKDLRGKDINITLGEQHIKVLAPLANVMIDTDKDIYTPNSNVHIDVNVNNTNSIDYSLNAQIGIYDSANILVASVDEVDIANLQSGDNINISSDWNTTNVVAGSYYAKVELHDTNGNFVDTDSASFAVVTAYDANRTISLNSSVSSYVFKITDTVIISNFIKNNTLNTTYDNVIFQITLNMPDGSNETIYTNSISSILPRIVLDEEVSHDFINAVPGLYSVTTTLVSENGDLLSTDTVNFRLVANIEDILLGSTNALYSIIEGNQIQKCMDKITYYGAETLEDKSIRQRLISLENGYVVSESVTIHRIEANVSNAIELERLYSQPLGQGEYSCVLEVMVNGEWLKLDNAVFKVETDIISNGRVVIYPLKSEYVGNEDINFMQKVENYSDSNKTYHSIIKITDTAGIVVKTFTNEVLNLASNIVNKYIFSLEKFKLNQGAYNINAYLYNEENNIISQSSSSFKVKSSPPVAQNDSIITNENTKVVIDVLENDNDKEGALDSTTLTIVKSAKHGSVAVVNGKVQYTPQINYSGEDTFYYSVKDSEGLISNVARVDIVINNSNEAPKAENQKLTTVINRHLDIMLAGNDPDGDTLKYSIMSYPKYGTLSSTLPNVLYVPNIDYIGNDYFTFKVNDGAVDSNIAIVNIGIKKETTLPPIKPCTCGCGCVPTPLPSNLHVPTGLKVSSITGNSAVLSWNDNSDNELFFVIYINGKAVTAVDANTTSYTLENLDLETRYVVYIKVYGENGSLDSKKLLFKTGNFAWLPAIYNILNKAGE